MLICQLPIILLLPLGVKSFKFLQAENRLIPNPVKFDRVMFNLDSNLQLTHNQSIDLIKTAKTNTEAYSAATKDKTIGKRIFTSFKTNIPKTLSNLEARFNKVFDAKFEKMYEPYTNYSINSCTSDVFTQIDDRIWYSYSVLTTLFKDLPDFAEYNVTKENLQILIATLGNIYYHLDAIIQNVDDFLIIRDSLDDALFTPKVQRDLHECFPSFTNYDYQITSWFRNATSYSFLLDITAYDYANVSGYLAIPYFNKQLGYDDQLFIRKIEQDYGSIRCNLESMQCDFYAFSKVCSLHLSNDSTYHILKHCPFSKSIRNYDITDRYLAVYSPQMKIEIDGINFPIQKTPYLLESTRAIKIATQNMEYNFDLPLATEENKVFHSSFTEKELKAIENSFATQPYDLFDNENLYDTLLSVTTSVAFFMTLAILALLIKHCVKFIHKIRDALDSSEDDISSISSPAASLNRFRPRRVSNTGGVNSVSLSPVIRTFLASR